MAKYRKKPVVIDAVQWRGSAQSWDEVMDLGDVPWKPGPMGSETFSIKTIDGNWAVVRKGAWVCKGVKGEFYPCEPDIFEQTYEPAQANAESEEVSSTDLLAELKRLRSFLHARGMHPDYEYETTDGPRKGFDEHEPLGGGWERNTDMGRDGWERFDYHEEAYWRRRKDNKKRPGLAPASRHV